MDDRDLEALARDGYFPDVSRHFMTWVRRVDRRGGVELSAAAGLVSRAAQAGHVCIDLGRLAGGPLPEAPPKFQDLRLPDWERWSGMLADSPAVGMEGGWAPLILTARKRLYIHRFHAFERRLAERLIARCGSIDDLPAPHRLGEALDRHFPPAPEGTVDWQKVAAVAAVLGRLSIVSGGPGTGKTTTVGRILAVLLALAPDADLRILLAAPTGKAAARLGDSLRSFNQSLPADDPARDRLPSEAATVHRLLRSTHAGGGKPGDDPHTLPADVLVVDEASMVDLALMARLMDILPDSARLVVLGDRDQLASVEAGSVFADICHPEGAGTYSEGFRSVYREVCGSGLPGSSAGTTATGPLADRITVLRKNWRFGDAGAIGRLARAIADGDEDAVVRCLSRDDPSVQWVLPGASPLADTLGAAAEAGYRTLLEAGDPETAIAALDRFRILCALRVGPSGSRRVNGWVENLLLERRRMAAVEGWYPGRPVVVGRNDYGARLFNGDCGVAMPEPGHGGLRVCFEGPGKTIRRFHPARVPEHESLFAMTVHKSQGSEYDEVFLVLPEADAPVLTRELLYTAVTRARKRVSVWGAEGIVRLAVRRPVVRTSGLMDRLWPG